MAAFLRRPAAAAARSKRRCENNRDLRIATLNIEQRARPVPDPARRALARPSSWARPARAEPEPPGSGTSCLLHRRPQHHRLRARPVRPRAQPGRRRAGAVSRQRGSAQGGADQPGRRSGQYLPGAARRRRPAARWHARPCRRASESSSCCKLRFDNGVSVASYDVRAGAVAGRGRARLAGAAAAPACAEPERARAAARPAVAGGPATGAAAAGARACSPTCPPGCRPRCSTRRPDVRQAEHAAERRQCQHRRRTCGLLPAHHAHRQRRHRQRATSAACSERTAPGSSRRASLLPIFDAGAQPGQPRGQPDDARHRRGAVRTLDPVRVPRSRRLAGRRGPRWASSCARRRAQAQAEETRYHLANLRYENGAASYLDVLDAQRALFLAQQGVVQSSRPRSGRTW